MAQDITSLARQYAEAKKRHDDQKSALDAISLEWTEIENQLLEAMVEEGVKSVLIDGLGLFSMATTSYLSVNAANKPLFYPYLKDSGHGSLLKEEVNPRTLTAFLKEHLVEVTRRYEEQGMDGIDARNEALKFLSDKGASYFTKREVRMTKK
jgi:hypothetical protein